METKEFKIIFLIPAKTEGIKFYNEIIQGGGA